MGAFAEFERSLIKDRVAQGDKKTHIARDFGVSRETLYQYLRIKS